MRLDISSAKVAADRQIAETKVSKKLLPGQNGTKRYRQEYGAALVCVRYRTDANRRRYTTVEIVVDERTLPGRVIAGDFNDGDIIAVRIEYHETELRARVKQAGAKWDSEQRVWRIPYRLAVQLGLQARVKQLKKQGA